MRLYSKLLFQNKLVFMIFCCSGKITWQISESKRPRKTNETDPTSEFAISSNFMTTNQMLSVTVLLVKDLSCFSFFFCCCFQKG